MHLSLSSGAIRKFFEGVWLARARFYVDTAGKDTYKLQRPIIRKNLRVGNAREKSWKRNECQIPFQKVFGPASPREEEKEKKKISITRERIISPPSPFLRFRLSRESWGIWPATFPSRDTTQFLTFYAQLNNLEKIQLTVLALFMIVLRNAWQFKNSLSLSGLTRAQYLTIGCDEREINGSLRSVYSSCHTLGHILAFIRAQIRPNVPFSWFRNYPNVFGAKKSQWEKEGHKMPGI